MGRVGVEDEWNSALESEGVCAGSLTRSRREDQDSCGSGKYTGNLAHT